MDWLKRIFAVCILGFVAYGASASCQAPDLPPEWTAQLNAIANEAKEAELDGNAERVAELDAKWNAKLREALKEEYGGVVSGVLNAAGVPLVFSDWWAAVAALFFKRPRRQLKAAGKKVAKGDLKGALDAVISVIGLLDSTPGSKAAAEAELEVPHSMNPS